MSHLLDVAYKDSQNIDSFGRLRVSNPVTIWDSQFEYNLHPLFYDTITDTNGTVTHSAAHSSALLTVTTDSGSTAIIQSFEYFRYQPGKSQRVAMTFLMAAVITDLDQRIGQFDANNGFFLEADGTTINFVRRSKATGSVVNAATPQASWNLDPFDGSGPSGMTLDLTKVQILIIDYQWLSAGRIRYGFDTDGVIHYAHEELVANTLAEPATTTANLPVRWEADTTGAIASQSVVEAICCSVISEGGQESQTGHPFSFGREAQAAANNVEEAFIGLRVATTLNSVAFHGKVIPERFNLMVSGSDCRWRLRYTPTTTTDVDFQAPVTHSAMQTDIATTDVAGGIVIDQGFIPSGVGQQPGAGGADFGAILKRLPLTLDADGGQTITLFLTIEGLGGTTTVSGSISWEEIR